MGFSSLPQVLGGKKKAFVNFKAETSEIKSGGEKETFKTKWNQVNHAWWNQSGLFFDDSVAFLCDDPSHDCI